MNEKVSLATGENNISNKNIVQRQEPQKQVEQKPSTNQEPKDNRKPQDAKITERIGKKLSELQEKQFDKKSSQVNSSNSRMADILNKSTSKNSSFRLPNIGDVSKNFGDKIYDKQSSATLQKSILVFSMPKGPRFGPGPKYSGEPSYYVDTCFKPNSPKGVGFGFGNKRQFPEWMERNMKENPSPGAYFDQPKHLTTRLKGPSFGISYKFYEKVTIPLQKSPQRSAKSSQRLKPLFRAQ